MTIKYGVIDTGNIGMYVGACAAHYGLETHLFLGAASISKLQIYSPLGDFLIDRPTVYTDIGQMPRCDILFLNINTLLELEVPLHQVSNYVNEGGVLVLFQKGVGQYLEFKQLSNVTILGGLGWLKPTKINENTLKHDFGDLIELGPYYFSESIEKKEIFSKMDAFIVKPFSGSRLLFKFREDFFDQLWTRYVFNLPYFILSTLYDKYSQEIGEDPFLAQQIGDIRNELLMASQCAYAKVDMQTIMQMDLKLNQSPLSHPGLKQDFDSEKPLHLSDIFQEILTLSQVNCISVPLVQVSHQALSEMEKKRDYDLKGLKLRL